MDYRIEGQGFYLDGEALSFFSGSFQYWRVDPSLWAGILEKVKGMGFGLVETYMPWSVHEVSRGDLDFGERDPGRDVGRFLTLCREAGVKVLARPGPHINAEMTYFGYPERLLADDAIAARSADGTPMVLPAPPRMFPVPCYHHPRFKEEAGAYLEAAAAVLKDHLHPGGSVIAVQADNECSKFFRVHPFDGDYSEHSVALYREFLEEKYPDIGALESAHRTRYGDFRLVDPPRRMNPKNREDLPRCLDWVEFGEYYINRAVRWAADVVRIGLGDGVPLFHNYPAMLSAPPFDIRGAEEFLDFQGVDSYPRRSAYHAIRCGMKHVSTLSRFPVLVEFSSGATFYSPILSLDDQRLTTWAALMHGIRGINFYMIVERERWYGSPIARDGSVRPEHYRFFGELLSRVRDWGLESMRCVRPVLLYLPREYERLAAAATVPLPMNRIVEEVAVGMEAPADLFVADERYGLEEPVAPAYARSKAFWYWALTATGAHFAVGDSSMASDDLHAYEIVIAPTFEFMDEKTQQVLRSYAQQGGTLVTGPSKPAWDSLMRPCGILSSLMDGGGDSGDFYKVTAGKGSLVHVGLEPPRCCSVADAEEYAPMVETVLRLGGVDPWFVPVDARVDVAVWTGGDATLVFVANPTDGEVTTSLVHCDEGRYTDLVTGAEAGRGPVIEVTLAPFSIGAYGKAV